MAANLETRWSIIQSASEGEPEARTTFARLYLPLIRSYLSARWSGRPLFSEIEDAVQEVFLDFFREGGALARMEPCRSGGGFRAYLFGVVRKVALRVETRRARDYERHGNGGVHPDQLSSNETSLSRIFDREWARLVMREAADLLTVQAHLKGAEAMRRIELLRLRFQEGLPIREIARQWGEDPAHLHHEYSRVRKEFLEALGAVVKARDTCPPEKVAEECKRLLHLLN